VVNKKLKKLKKTKKMETKIFTKLIKLNVSNRPLNSKTVDWYAKQMAAGEWTLSGQTISISDLNTLLDGQHRLAAVIKSNCCIMFNVAYNVPYESFVNYDNMRSRGLGDVFAVENIPNYKSIAAILSKYNALKNGNEANMGFSNNTNNHGSGFKNIKFTNSEALKLYNANKDLIQRIYLISDRCYCKIKLFTRSQVGAIIYYLIQDLHHDKNKVFSFFQQLFFNENVENKSIYYLREKLINGSIGNFRMVSRLRYIYLIKCWNAYIIGKEIKNYSFNDSDVMQTFK